jgi:hypothetical protein
MAFAPTHFGRMEKRLPIAILVHLAPEQDNSASRPELTYTHNVSAHGACVVSTRPWQPGEIAEVTSLQDPNVNALHGKVVHCHRRGDDRYGIGLTFLGIPVPWSTYNTYARLP